MSDAARYLRQVLLPEIGAEGQARIQGASAAVGGAGLLSNEIAELYARAAGFRAIVAGVIDVSELAPLADVRSLPAREVLAGSRAALAAIREAAQIPTAQRGRGAQGRGASDRGAS